MSGLEYFGLVPTVLIAGFFVIVIAFAVAWVIEIFFPGGREGSNK